MDSETASLINIITGSRLTIDEQEEKVDMCQAIDEMRQESREEGAEANCLQNIRNVMEGLKYTAQQAMDLLKIPASDRQKYLAKLQ